MDDAIISALERAVEASPENVDLRVHLGEVLIRSDRAQDAAAHLVHALSLDPVNEPALRLAIQAATAMGDHVRAQAWTRVLDGLTGLEGLTGLGGLTGENATPGISMAAPEERIAVTGSAEFNADVDGESDMADQVKRYALDVFLDDLLGTATKPITLADVGGLEDVKRRLEMSFLTPLRNPELRSAYGKSLRGGLLLYGPPGCGKTYVARAIAGELGAQFFSIGLNDVLDMWMGESERKLHELFEHARRNAPCVLFFDEVDALGLKRTNLQQSAGRNVVVQLLTELDSLGSDNEGIFTIGATNQPWDLDPALRRPGRFDRMLLVLPPDANARAAILRTHAAELPCGTIDFETIAKLTDGFSGADLRLLCESATEVAMNEAYASGSVVPVETRHFQAGRAKQASSVRPWFDVAGNFAMFSNTDGQYDDLLKYMKEKKYL